MKRRKAIIGISVAGAGIVAGTAGYKWYSFSKKPDIAFAENNKDLIAAIAETIIPATDTPGAKDAGVHDFILKMIKDCSTIKTQNNFIDGLKDLQAYSKKKYDRSYQECSPADQHQILKYFEQKDISSTGLIGKVRNRVLGKSFFAIMKERTVEGYCTSKLGATQALAYVFIPGSYQGCIDMAPGQKGWATN